MESKSAIGSASDMFVRLIGAFVAGFVGVLAFHQLAWALLHFIGVTPVVPYKLQPIAPFGVPLVLSQAFWGGLWGIALALVLASRSNANYWLLAFVFGLIAPTLVGWTVVPLIKGTPLMGGPPWMTQVVRPIPNVVWGIGTAWLLTLLPGKFAWRAQSGIRK